MVPISERIYGQLHGNELNAGSVIYVQTYEALYRDCDDKANFTQLKCQSNFAILKTFLHREKKMGCHVSNSSYSSAKSSHDRNLIETSCQYILYKYKINRFEAMLKVKNFDFLFEISNLINMKIVFDVTFWRKTNASMRTSTRTTEKRSGFKYT